MIVTVGIAGNLQRRFGKIRVFHRPFKSVRLVIGIRVRKIREETHVPVFVIVIHRTLRRIDGQGLIMRAEAVTVGVGI